MIILNYLNKGIKNAKMFVICTNLLYLPFKKNCFYLKIQIFMLGKNWNPNPESKSAESESDTEIADSGFLIIHEKQVDSDCHP